MNSISGLGKVLLIGLAIPTLGFVVSFLILQSLNSEAQMDVNTFCQIAGTLELSPAEATDVKALCSEVNNIKILGQSSLGAGLIALLIPALYFASSKYAGESRQRIASVFPLLVRLSILLIAGLVLLQGAILTYALYVGESYLIGRVHLFLIGAIGLGALFAGVQLIKTCVTFGKKLKTTAIGQVLDEKIAPDLFGVVRHLATQLGSKPPEKIIVGLEPTFYVTSCDIEVVGGNKTVTGETLFISAPLARLLSKEEFLAVIGHELGHFRGEDTVYSMRFAPIFAGLGNAIQGVNTEEDEGASAFAKIPALAMLSYMYESFASNEAKISRVREFKADEAGAEAASPLALSTALIKVSLYSSLWSQARQQNVERLSKGKVTGNLSLVFRDLAQYDVEHERLEEILKEVLDVKIAHPTDSHPTVGLRLEALGIKPEMISKEMLLVPNEPSAQIIDNCEVIEKEVTIVEHKLMVALGLVNPPEKEAEENQLLQATYCLAASMVSADGRIDPKEIAIAESAGLKMFEDFDSVEFRQYCNQIDQLPEIVGLSEVLGGVLDDEGKELIIKYLRAISEADGNVSPEEEALLKLVGSSLGVSMKANE